MPKIDYKKLRSINPEAARVAVLEYLYSNGRNVADCARTFRVQRAVVYDILKKQQEGSLKDRSKAPKHLPTKTSDRIEALVVDAKNKTGFGTKWLLVYLVRYRGTDLTFSTVRNILRRNKDKIIPRSRISWKELENGS